MNYIKFLDDLDNRLNFYFDNHKEFVCCQKGCSFCCETGDYPLSEIELKYLMQGYIALDNEQKIKIQQNIKEMKPGGVCPFLINKECSVYPYRPIICRVHGLAYKNNTDKVKVPYCVNFGKNYAKVYKDGEIFINPVLENLDTPSLLGDYDYGEIKNLYDWLHIKV